MTINDECMKILLLSLCLGLLSLNAFPQSKLQGAGKASKVGGTTVTPKKPATNTNKRSSGGGDKYASKGYMDILGLSFANADSKNTVIDNYGSKLYAKEVKYLKAKITYNGLATEEKEITLSVKIFDEEDKLQTYSNSPNGYTYNQDVIINPGKGQSITLLGWGTEKGGSFSVGLYKMEVWYKGNLLYSKEVRLYSGTTPIVSNSILSISSVSFANTDKDGNIISGYGQPLYGGKVKYLKPKIYYNGKYSTNQEVVLYVRYFESSGDMVSGSSSPVGFSHKESVTIKPGSSSVTLLGFGNDAATNYKEGTCKMEIWLDGEKLYETNITIRKAESSGTYSGGNEMNLQSMLEKPMMIGKCNPYTDSYSTVKASLSSIYTVDDNSDDVSSHFYIWTKDNSSISSFSYHGFPLDYFYYMVRKSASSSLQRRISYKYEINKSQMESLEDAYACFDKIVKDFKDIGINISYQRKKDDSFLRAKDGIRIGNREYEISLEEYSNNFRIAIDVWIWK